MAHKKGGGSSKNGRDSNSQRLGVKRFGGQVVKAGFMNWRISLWLRRLITMLPSLVILALSVNTTDALVFSQIVLSFGIPFALVPLLLITRKAAVMGDMANRTITNVAMTLITVIISSLNVYLLYATFADMIG